MPRAKQLTLTEAAKRYGELSQEIKGHLSNAMNLQRDRTELGLEAIVSDAIERNDTRELAVALAHVLGQSFLVSAAERLPEK